MRHLHFWGAQFPLMISQASTSSFLYTLLKINPNKPAKISCSIQVKEYWAQAPPQDISPLLKSVPTNSNSSLSSWGSFTISHRCMVGLVAFAMRARTCNTFYKIIHLSSYYMFSPKIKHYTNVTIDTIQTYNNRIAVKDTEQQELWFLAGGNVKRYSQFERQLGNFLQS